MGVYFGLNVSVFVFPLHGGFDGCSVLDGEMKKLYNESRLK